MPAPAAAMALKAALKTKTGQKAIKGTVSVAILCLLLPLFMMLAIIYVMTTAALGTSAGTSCPGAGNGTTGSPQSDAAIAMSAIYGVGVTDKDHAIVMVAIADAETGFNAAFKDASGEGEWRISQAAYPKGYPPNEAAGWFTDPGNSATAAMDVAGGASLPNLTYWNNDPAYQAFVNAGGLKNWSIAGTLSDSGGYFAAAQQAWTEMHAANATPPAGGGCCGGTSGSGGGSGVTSAQQQAYASAIVGIGKTMNMGSKGELIALMVALDESGLKEYANSNVPASMNYPHDAVGSDHGSVGIFQQQVNPDGSNFGWGTLDQLMNATDGTHYQAYRFYAALQAVNGWQTMDPWVAAQAVQRSAFSSGMNYYAQMGAAQSLLNVVGGAPPLPLPAGASAGSGGSGGSYSCATGNGSTQSIAAAATALDQMNPPNGIPYCYGGGHTQPAQINMGLGPSYCWRGPGLDCSGAVAYVLQHGGVTNFQTDVASGYMNLPWQKLGSGIAPYQVTNHPGVQLYASSAHTFLVINGKVFSSGTVTSPTGGPHWRTWDAASEESGDGPIMWVVLQVPGTS